jgi:hypothetical protein
LFGPSTCRESIDFFLLKDPAPDPERLKLSGDNESSEPDLRLTLSTFSSMNVLNSFGANSGCSLAGTQNNFDGSSSSVKLAGATDGTLNPEAKEGRSGSEATSIDIRRIACRLLNSCATAAGLDS